MTLDVIKPNFSKLSSYSVLADFMERSTSFLTKLFDKIQPFLRGNGGPIIMVQVTSYIDIYN